MRAASLSFVSFFILFFQVVILSTIISHSAYKNSVEQGLEDSVTLAVSMIQKGFSERVEESSITNNVNTSTSDLKTNFISYLSDNLDSRITGLTVNIYGADEENGILSVEVFAKFKYLNGKEDEVSCYKTAILNTTLK